MIDADGKELTEKEFYSEFASDFGFSLNAFTRYSERFTSIDDTRYCRWAGQSADGRKHRDRMGVEPFPWEGAADTQVRLADQFITEDVDLMLTVLKNAKISCVALDAGKMDEAQVMETILDYWRTNVLAREIMLEGERAAQWRQHYGYSVSSVQWYQQTDTEMRSISLMDVVQMAQQNQEVAAMLSYLYPVIVGEQEMTDEQLDVASKLLEDVVPDIPNPKRAIKDLVKKGVHDYEAPYLRENRPRIYAMRVGLDVFFPVNTDSSLTAEWMAQRLVLSEAELEDMSTQEEWDADFVDGCRKRMGSSVIWSAIAYWASRAMVGRAYTWMDDMYRKTEVFVVWHRTWEDGVQKTYRLIYHPEAAQFGKKEINPFEHGKLPFTDHVRERVDRYILASRGVTEIISSVQSEVKAQRDFRVDRTSLDVIPPLTVPLGRGKTKYNLGPGVQVGVMSPNEVNWMALPPMSETTVAVEQAAMTDAREYFGKRGEGIDPNKVAQKMQRLADGWLNEWAEIFVQVAQLSQQFMTDQQIAEILQVQNSPFRMSAEEIRGRYSISIEFDTRDLDMEFLQKKLELIAQFVVPLDAGGVIDRNLLTQLTAQSIGSGFARLLVRNPQGATASEINAEQDALMKILNGIDPPMVENGANWQLRLQTLMQTIQGSPTIQGQIQSSPEIKARLQKHMQALQFQIQQQQNAQIGKFGVSPGQAQPVAGNPGQLGPPGQQS